MENNLISIVMLLLGLAVGVVAAWAALRNKSNQSYENGKADSVAKLAAFQERIAAREQELAGLKELLGKELLERERLRDQNGNLKAELEGERRAAKERTESFKQAADELAVKFKALSQDALHDNNQSF